MDRGAPEPIRTALVEGARWWDQAFQAAGWAKGTFRVDLLPEGADPMDVRYNIIQWVHRYTRGWSYGDAIADPRTGEIIKGNVTLGSLRGRQDYLIAEALLSPYGHLRARADTGRQSDAADGAGAHPAAVGARNRAHARTGAQLCRIKHFAGRQRDGLSASVYHARRNGHVDVSHAYATGIGDWDKVCHRLRLPAIPCRTRLRTSSKLR